MSAIASGILSSLSASALIDRRRSVPFTRKRAVLIGIENLVVGIAGTRSPGPSDASTPIDGELRAADADVLADERVRRRDAEVRRRPCGPTTATRWRPSSSAAVNMRPACSAYLRTSR